MTSLVWLNIACAGANGLLAGLFYMRWRLMRQHLGALPPIFNGMKLLIEDYNRLREALREITQLQDGADEHDCSRSCAISRAIAVKALLGQDVE